MVNELKLKSYFLYCIDKLKLYENLIHSRINAIKFYFEQVLHQEKMFFEIPRPKKPSLLPKAISTRDIKKMLSVVENKKHKLLLKMCYGMGLRVSELVNIKINDIDSGSMRVLVSRGKGKKDRYVNLPESILLDLRTYYKEYRPEEYLFEGQSGGQYSARSAQLVFKSAMKKAKINKKVGIHGLRHSYATHLIEQGRHKICERFTGSQQYQNYAYLHPYHRQFPKKNKKSTRQFVRKQQIYNVLLTNMSP